MPTEFIDTNDLAARWGVAASTVSDWRYRRVGPRWCHLVGAARYLVSDIEDYESAALATSVHSGA